MKWKIKTNQLDIYENWFAIYPVTLNGYRYWLCWMTIVYRWNKLSNMYFKFFDIVDVGRKANLYKRGLINQRPE